VFFDGIVPDLTDVFVNNGCDLLGELGYAINQEWQVIEVEAAEGLILRQQPPGGTQLDPPGPVTIWMGKLLPQPQIPQPPQKPVIE
jgi:beta-lactam-binding protein with PASTA domain